MKPRLAATLVAFVVLAGCASSRIANSSSTVDPAVAQAPPAIEPQFERGRPNAFVDGVGWVFGIPAKISLWDRRAENHHVSTRVDQDLAEYMAIHGMASTKVRINQYDPGGEWRRLVANKQVGAGWRYTVGVVSTIGYTILPGRVFSGLVGGDNYNPYTDSIYVYSDIPAVAIEQAAHAKDVRSRSLPGTYATVVSLPIISLYPEKSAKDEVYAYAGSFGTPEEQLAARRALYPEFGSEIGGQAGLFVPGTGLLLSLAGAGVGHAVDRFSGPPTAHYDEASMSAALAGKARLAAAQGEVVMASSNEPVVGQGAGVSVADRVSVEPVYR